VSVDFKFDVYQNKKNPGWRIFIKSRINQNKTIKLDIYDDVLFVILALMRNKKCYCS
jgi:hypothetical protein